MNMKMRTIEQHLCHLLAGKPNGPAQAAWRTDRIPQTVAESIPFQTMYENGICFVGQHYYTATLAFEDAAYRLLPDAQQEQMFRLWCKFHDYFGSGTPWQLTCSCYQENPEIQRRLIQVPPRGDDADQLRREYEKMLQDQLAKGNNAIRECRYLTFGTLADSYADACRILEKRSLDILHNFRVMGVTAWRLDGTARLRVLYRTFHPSHESAWLKSWRDAVKAGNHLKNWIGPPSFDFRLKNEFRMGDVWGSVCYMDIHASRLQDTFLSDLMMLEIPLTVTVHHQPIDYDRAVKFIKRRMTDITAMKIDEEKKSFQSGYSMDNLPPDLNTMSQNAAGMLNAVQFKDQRMSYGTITILHTAPTLQQLRRNVARTDAVAREFNCELIPLSWQQERGLMTSLPLGVNEMAVGRPYLTKEASGLVPFASAELFQNDQAAQYYGLNATSNRMIRVSRKRLKTPNGLFLGIPGSGKSFAAKSEIVDVLLNTDDDIIIADPENEYAALVEQFHGQNIDLSSSSRQYINPLDLNAYYGDGGDPLNAKAEFMLSFFEQIFIGADSGVQPQQKSVIDECLSRVYRKYRQDPQPENMPVLQDVYHLLCEFGKKDPQAVSLAQALKIYVTGSFNVFNHRTNVDLHNRLVCFNLRNLGSNLKHVGMLILEDQVWNRVTANRARHKTTWFYCDEFHLLLKDPQTAAYSVNFWKRFRKWNGVPTGITQNAQDLLNSSEVQNIFDNSDFILLLQQPKQAAETLAQHLGISPQLLSYLIHAQAGSGLLLYGNDVLPFVNPFPKDTELYRLMNTKPEEEPNE